MGGSPGLVVMVGDSCSKGCEFESWHRILDGHFFTYLFCVRKDDYLNWGKFHLIKVL